MKAVQALVARETTPTKDGRVISEVTVPNFMEPPVPVLDGRPGMAREVIGTATLALADLGATRGVVAVCTIYDDAAAALLARDTPLRLVADMAGEVEHVDEQEFAIRVFTEPETRPYPRFRLVGEVRAVTLTPVPAWDDLWVQEIS